MFYLKSSWTTCTEVINSILLSIFRSVPFRIRGLRGLRIFWQPSDTQMPRGHGLSYNDCTSLQLQHLLRLHHRPTNPHGLPIRSSIRRAETNLRLQMARQVQAPSRMPSTAIPLGIGILGMSLFTFNPIDITFKLNAYDIIEIIAFA